MTTAEKFTDTAANWQSARDDFAALLDDMRKIDALLASGQVPQVAKEWVATTFGTDSPAALRRVEKATQEISTTSRECRLTLAGILQRVHTEGSTNA